MVKSFLYQILRKICLLAMKTLEGGNGDCDLTFEASCSSSECHLLTQGDCNDLIRDVNLSKKKLNPWVPD